MNDEGKPPRRKPVRVITDGVEDAALSYLENCLSIKSFDSEVRNESAGFVRRIAAGILDLLLMALLATPFAALIEFAGGNWADRRTIGFMAGAPLFLKFCFITIFAARSRRQPA